MCLHISPCFPGACLLCASHAHRLQQCVTVLSSGPGNTLVIAYEQTLHFPLWTTAPIIPSTFGVMLTSVERFDAGGGGGGTFVLVGSLLLQLGNGGGGGADAAMVVVAVASIQPHDHNNDP